MHCPGWHITYTDAPVPQIRRRNISIQRRPVAKRVIADYDTTRRFLDAKSQSQPEILAILCANDEFKVWLKAQRHSLPERDARTAKIIRLSYLCRRALHLSDVAAPIPPMPLKARSWAAADTLAELVRSGSAEGCENNLALTCLLSSAHDNQETAVVPANSSIALSDIHVSLREPL